MRWYLSLTIIVFWVLITACSNSTQNITSDEPLPPDPFPIHLTTYVSTFEVEMKQETAQLKLQSMIQKNTKLNEHIILSLEQFHIIDDRQEEQQAKVLFHGDTELYVKKKLIEQITLPSYGEYRLVITAEYGVWGQSHKYDILFDEHGVRITEK